MPITARQIDQVMTEKGCDWFGAYKYLLIKHHREAFEYETLVNADCKR